MIRLWHQHGTNRKIDYIRFDSFSEKVPAKIGFLHGIGGGNANTTLWIGPLETVGTDRRKWKAEIEKLKSKPEIYSTAWKSITRTFLHIFIVYRAAK